MKTPSWVSWDALRTVNLELTAADLHSCLRRFEIEYYGPCPFLSKKHPWLKPSHLHCNLHPEVNHSPLQKQKFLRFVTLYMNNGTRQHINPHYKTKLVALIQSFLCQQMETFNNSPFRTSSVDTDCYMLRQGHAQAEHVHAMQPWSARLHLTYSDSPFSCKATRNPSWTKTTTKL